MRVEGAVLVTPGEVLEGAVLRTEGDRIRSVGAAPPGSRGADLAVDAAGCTVFPGLVNIHDHLVGTWSPKAGEGPYPNIYAWLDWYMVHGIRNERKRIPDDLIVRLGALRNLLSGVTTVVDHFSRDPAYSVAGLPLRVEHDFAREWVWRSVTDPAAWPPWGRGLEKELETAGSERPFVIHIAEGVDDECRAELAALEAAGALKENTVLVHGVAFTEEDVARVARAKAKVVWCPASNLFLYGRTADVKALLDAGVSVSLGTDSTVSGSAHILEELGVARDAWTARAGSPLPAHRLVEMVTREPARALRREGFLGVLAPGAAADFLLLESVASDPHGLLVDARPSDIGLVVFGGRPVLGATRFAALFDALGPPPSRFTVQGREMLVAEDPLGILAEVRRILGFEKTLHFLPIP